MFGKTGLLSGLWLLSALTCAADEHPACTDTGYDWPALASDELHAIAAGCAAAPFAELNHHRAWLRELLDEDAAVAGLIVWSVLEREPEMESHGVHMLLLEQLAPLYYPATGARIAFLNEQYEFRNEIAELWLRGYGTLAIHRDARHAGDPTLR